MSGTASLERLCGGMIVGGYLGQAPTTTFLASLSRGHLGGAILFKRNLPSIEAAFDSCARLLATLGSGPPPILAVDQEGGRVVRLPPPATRLPPMMALASLGDESLVERAGRVTAGELAALGFNLDFAPVLDVNTNPSNPVIGDRAFGTTPEQVCRFALAFARGLRAGGVAACGKHFPGHGDTSVDSHLALPSVGASIERLRAVELVPFRAAIEAGIESLMSAHVVCEALAPGRPATLAPEIATGLLRGELGFEGVLFSDDLEMRAISARWSTGEAAVGAVRAGCDALLVCESEERQHDAHEALVRACEADAGFRARCEQAAARVGTLRGRLPAGPARCAGEMASALRAQEARELVGEIALRLGQIPDARGARRT
jgi:beta-N-acetylhexosaminidase